MYSKIVNPLTGRKVSVTGKLGKTILNTYLNILSGGEGGGRGESRATLTEDSLKINLTIKRGGGGALFCSVNINPNKTITDLVEEIINKLNKSPSYTSMVTPAWNKDILKLIDRRGGQKWPPIAPMTATNTLKDMNIIYDQDLYFIKQLFSIETADEIHAIRTLATSAADAARAEREDREFMAILNEVDATWGDSYDSDDDSEEEVPSGIGDSWRVV
jgi:hypothetical protein